MTIDIFTKEQFEQALPVHKNTGEPLWKPLGLQWGEYTYLFLIDDLTGVEIRSSVRVDGYSADTGRDSIRVWLVTHEEKPALSKGAESIIITRPLGSKVNEYTTRVPGWQKRLTTKIKTLWKWRKKAGNCPSCDQPLGIYRVKRNTANKGRIFAKCDEEKHGWTFVWITDHEGEII